MLWRCKSVSSKLLCLFFSVSTFYATFSYGQTSSLPDGPHPRIWLTPGLKSQLIQKRSDNTQEWQAVKSWADRWLNESTSHGIDRLIPIMGLMYQVTNDVKYASRAKEYINSVMLSWDCSDGNGYRGSGWILPLAYDWLYDTLSAQEKIIYYTKMNECAELHKGHRFADSDEEMGNMRAIGFTGIATYGDNPEAAKHFNFARNTIWQDFAIPYLDHGEGGAWMEGMRYGSNTMRYILEYTFALETATGEDLWATNDFPTQVILGMIHLTLPGNTVFLPYSDIEDTRYSIGERQIKLMMLASHLRRSNTGAMAQFWLTGKEVLSQANLFYGYIFSDVSAPQIDYREVLSPDYFAPGIGIIISRSDWTDDATYMSFMSGWSGVDHQHQDANTFQIFRKGEWLSKEVIGYDGPAVIIEAHNGIMIENAVNDGPNVFRHAGPAAIRKYALEDEYVYALGDAANRYNSDYHQEYHVELAEREFVYLKPDIVITFDRIATKDDTKYKKLIQHYPYQPVNVDDYIECNTGTQKIFTKFLLPENSNLSIIDERVYWRNALDYQIAPSEKTWHIKLEPSSRNAHETFFTVNYLADSGSMPETVKFETFSGSMVGAHIKASPTNYAALFRKKQGFSNSAQYSLTTNAPSVHLVCDFEPGATYKIERNGQIIAEMEATFAGTIYFEDSFQGLADYEIELSAVTSVEGNNGGIVPQQINLLQSYPNPFNPRTTIFFSISTASAVSLQIYNLRGQRIRTLLERSNLEPGKQQVEWDGRDGQGNVVSSGIYIYKVDDGTTVLARKMVLTK